jgi:RNA-directed DNA polymerase
MRSITNFITQKLKLKVNETKSAVARPQQRKFLGFSFSDGPEVLRIIAPKALERFKQRVREITRRAKGVSLEATMAELASYMPLGAGLSRFRRRDRLKAAHGRSHDREDDP